MYNGSICVGGDVDDNALECLFVYAAAAAAAAAVVADNTVQVMYVIGRLLNRRNCMNSRQVFPRTREPDFSGQSGTVYSNKSYGIPSVFVEIVRARGVRFFLVDG